MHSQGGKRPAAQHQIWWQLALFVGCTTLAVLGGILFEKKMSDYLPETRTLHSSLNTKPSGYSGLLEIASKAGFKTRQWQQPYRQLANVAGTLVIVAPLQSPAKYEAEQILDWVSKGNNLVYLDHFDFSYQKRMLELLGMDSRTGQPLSEKRVDTAGKEQNTDIFKFVDHLILTTENRLTGGTPLLGDDAGAFFSIARHGKGEVLVGNVPSLATNRRLGSKEDWPNFQFLLNAFSTMGGDIYFDELSHGFSGGHNVFVFLGKGPLGLIFSQLMVILLIGVIAACQRFGATRVVPVKRKASSLEFITGMANAYQRARATDLAWQIINHSFHTKLARLLQMSPKEAPPAMAERWSETVGEGSGDLRALLERSDGPAAAKPSQEELLELVGTCDKISERLDVLRGTKKAGDHD